MKMNKCLQPSRSKNSSPMFKFAESKTRRVFDLLHWVTRLSDDDKNASFGHDLKNQA